MEAEITTKHLQGTSDLTLLAKIKPGLVGTADGRSKGTLDTRTYATRLRAALKTLHTLRQTSREYSMVRTFSDSTDRIRTITDLRMAILEDEQKLLLSVTFDRPWEPYLRIIWSEVGKQLDLIFCNCEEYPISVDSTFEEYGAWITKARTNTQFFYKESALTFDDMRYLRQTERLLSEGAGDMRLEAAKLQVSDPEQLAKSVSLKYAGYTAKQGMQALSILYRLADFYPPDSNDGPILLRASRELLKELAPALNALKTKLPVVVKAIETRFAAQLAWFATALPQAIAAAPPPAPASKTDVQGGILKGYDDITHGCVILVAFNERTHTANFLGELAQVVYTNAQQEQKALPKDNIYVNVALTPEGLLAAGLTEAELKEAFAGDFIEGMQTRAGLIGDMRSNHPRNWRLPERYCEPPTAGPGAVIDLSTVHMVIQMCISAPGDASHALAAPLAARIRQMRGTNPDIAFLAVQPTRRYPDPATNRPREHFGYIDGISQPEPGDTPPTGIKWSNNVTWGEILSGYQNDHGDPPKSSTLTDNGSYLVVRKLRQDVAALNNVIAASSLAADVVKANMMGRTVDGDPLAQSGAGNAFDYKADTEGARCPYTSHVRRTNPRTDNVEREYMGVKRTVPTVPRIMRRGMSYGPRYDPAADKTLQDAERGVMFMCYNASISEQFEVIQRWINGGNSTNVFSDHVDPLLGVPQAGESRTFRFHNGTATSQVRLDEGGDKPAIPLVRLDWGLYAFAPSLAGLAELKAKAASRPVKKFACPRNMPISGPDEGEALIQRLMEQQRAAKTIATASARESELRKVASEWKMALEDGHARSSGLSASIWEAVRGNHGGVIDTGTDYGILVGSKALVMEVLTNADKATYTVNGYVPRLQDSIGQMYLGLDDDDQTNPVCPYKEQSAVTNAAIMALTESEAFDEAFAKAKKFLATNITGPAKGLAAALGEPEWEITLDTKEVSDATLADLCELWFGLNNTFVDASGNAILARGGSPWNWKAGQAPYYPGHFTAPSRYVFQPLPGDAQEALGQERGKALRTAMTRFVNARRAALPLAAPPLPPAKIADPMFTSITDDDLLARTVLGTLIGFLPTVEGNFRATLNEWLEEKTFWELQNAYAARKRGNGAESDYARAVAILNAPLKTTMQFRPAPELGWRQAARDHQLGPAGIPVSEGQRLVTGLVSATQEDLFAGNVGGPDVYPVFGGDKRAASAPTHACPGYNIGIGVLMGMLAALMEQPSVRPTPAALTVSLGGKT